MRSAMILLILLAGCGKEPIESTVQTPKPTPTERQAVYCSDFSPCKVDCDTQWTAPKCTNVSFCADQWRECRAKLIYPCVNASCYSYK